MVRVFRLLDLQVQYNKSISVYLDFKKNAVKVVQVEDEEETLMGSVMVLRYYGMYRRKVVLNSMWV